MALGRVPEITCLIKHCWPRFLTTSIVGLVVEFVVAIDEARVRFTDDALSFFFFDIFILPFYKSVEFFINSIIIIIIFDQ